MTMKLLTKLPLPGNWRSGAYGANRRVHLWTTFGTTNRHPACWARLDYAKTGRRSPSRSADYCYDCLTNAAAGRA